MTPTGQLVGRVTWLEPFWDGSGRLGSRNELPLPPEVADAPPPERSASPLDAARTHDLGAAVSNAPTGSAAPTRCWPSPLAPPSPVPPAPPVAAAETGWPSWSPPSTPTGWPR